MTQADLKARAREVLLDSIAVDRPHNAEVYRTDQSCGILAPESEIIRAMLTFATEARANALKEAAEACWEEAEYTDARQQREGEAWQRGKYTACVRLGQLIEALGEKG